MLTYEKQALSGTIEVLLRSELPDEFEGTKLYGSLEEDELRQECKIFRLSNETGHGRITVYQVFSGIELYYNDMHMGYCNQNQATAKNMIEINHCLIGRFECSFGENSCCYMAEGDLSISSMMKKKSNSCFPLNHYHGISIVINLDELLPEVRQIMELLNIDLHYIQKYICEGNRCCIMRANPSIEHIFSELYHVREKRKPGYMKVKMLELLLFLSDLNTAEEVLQTDYFNQNQVALIKAVASYIIQGFGRQTIKYLIVCGIFIVLRLLSGGQGITILMPEMFLFMVLRILMMVMAAQPVIGMPPGEVVAVFKKIHAPNGIALPVTFMLRFFPTVRSEFSDVFSSLRLRKLLSWKHPLDAMEYIVTPVIFRSSRIAEELAASAESRGISNPGKHTCRRKIEFQKRDWIMCVIAVCVTAFYFVLERTVA